MFRVDKVVDYFTLLLRVICYVLKYNNSKEL